MKKILSLLLLFFCTNADMYAQYFTSQNKIWAFGYNAGFDFTSGSPVPITTAIYPLGPGGYGGGVEGSASVCNSSGSLLFYSDGQHVYNSTGALMSHGNNIVSYQTWSSTQGTLIVPVFGSSTRYYIFSLQHSDSNAKLAYSIVDMALDGGNGDVDTTARGIIIDSGFAEKMTAIAGNNCDIWVLTHVFRGSTFKAFRITPAGVTTTPVTSSAGTYGGYMTGVIKASHDRKKLVTQMWYDLTTYQTQLYDFNPSTGSVSNCQVLGTTFNPYGAEFSPDNTKLYSMGAVFARLYQYDISLGSTAAIAASRTQIDSALYGSDLRLGPDNKIYYSLTDTGKDIHCIQYPNNPGTTCGVLHNAVRLNSGTYSCLSYGNPVMLVTPADTFLTRHDTLVCIPSGGSVNIRAHDTTLTGSYLWNDGTTTTLTKSITTAGTYWVRIYYGCKMLVDTIHVNVHPVVGPITGTMNTCVGSTSTLSDTTAGGIWTSNSTTVATVGSLTGIVTGNAAGTTTITYTASTGCLVTAPFTVNPLPAIISGPSQVCVGSNISLTNTTSGGTWSRSNTNVTLGSTGIVTGVIAGTTIVTYTLPTGCYRTTVVTINPLPAAIAGLSTVCTGASITLTDATTGGTWSRSNTNVTVNSTTGVVTGVTTSTTVITYTLPTGCIATKTITVTSSPGIITGTMSVCVGLTTVLSNPTSGGSWITGALAIASVGSTGVVTGAAAGVAPITYMVSPTCSATTSVTVIASPAAITGPSSVCEGSSITLSNTTSGGTWSVSNSNATVGSTGIVTGVTAGTITISYTLSTGCNAIKNITVNPTPGPITGLSNVCSGATYTGYCTGAGYWSSSSSACMTIGSASGIVTVIALCPSTICNTNSFGCSRCLTVSVNPMPTLYTVTGGGNYCAGGAGLHVGLSSSSIGVNYELYRGGVGTGTILAGTGGVLDFGLQTAAGTYTVMATIATTGCNRVMSGSVSIFIIPLPTLTCGPSAVCVGGSIAPCTPSPAGGTWTSSNTAVATVGSSSGIVGGISLGTATITYAATGGCIATSNITVTTAPCPLSLSNVCSGGVATFTNCISGGLWTSSNPSIANIGSVTGTVTGGATGTATISYSLGSSSCTVTGTMAVISSIAPITGPTFACVGSTATLSHTTTGGIWSSSNTSVATVGSTGIVTGAGTGIVTISYAVSGCTTTKAMTVNAMPAAIAGTSTLCVGDCATQTNSVAGGVWTSGVTAVATIGSSTGTVCAVTTGTALITYSIGGCYVTKPVTVFATPTAISGATTVCVGATTTLTNGLGGGTWASTTTSVATIGSTGAVTGVAPGFTTISYTMPSGCSAALTISVVPAPAAISGVPNVCTGVCETYTNVTPGGTWSSSPLATGTMGAATGTYCGIAAGTATITYTLGGCTATKTVTVSIGPAAITGTTNVCVGSTITLSDATPGGTWGSSDVSIATIGSSSGVVTGISTGTIMITYSAGSCPPAATAIIVNDVLPITGTPVVCVGQTTYLTDASLIGSWSSSSSTVATISSSGLVAGVGPGTATISYTMPTGCVATIIVTVNPNPPALTGPSIVCAGQTVTLGPPTLTGGSWVSAYPSIATVSSTGVVSGVSVGFTPISYVLSSTGCVSEKTVTVYAAPPAITGVDDLCTTMCATFTNPVPGGAWSSSSSVATVSSTGLVCAGASVGTVIISYTTSGSGCAATKSVNIVLPPASITGPSGICAYSTATLTSTTSGGVWTSSNPVVASIGSTSGMVYGNAAGVATITYTLGCPTTRSITVNVAPPAITGSTNICTGITTHLSNPLVGGRWYSSDTTIATVDSLTGVVTGINPGAAVITYGLSNGCSNSVTVIVNPGIAPIVGANTVCIGTSSILTDASPGGVWVSSNPSIATVTGSGIVTGAALGTATISYVVSGICPVTMVVTVNPVPGVITGTTVVCAGSNTTLSNPVSGGVWSSGSTSTAVIHPSTGVVTGITAGIAPITYTMGVSCEVITYVTVNPLPLPITGSNNACTGGTFLLFDPTTGGTWSSTTPSIASISSTGVVTGSTAGPATISYTISTGCAATYPVTINPMPGPISGSSAVCLSGTTMLTDAVTGGTWTSSAAGTMTIGSSSGVVSGISMGTATITYELTPGCYVTKTLSVSPLPFVFTVTGGGNYCGGGTGVHIGLSGSAVGVNYMLHLGATAVGTFAGTGGPIDFGLHTVTGTYTVTGTSTATTCSVAMAGSATVAIMPFVTPAVSFSRVPSDTICSGATVIFTPIPVNGGTAPTYRWSVNGTTVSAASTYSFIPADGDVVKVKMISNAMCPLPDSAVYQDTISVIPFGTPTVNLVASPNDTVCKGTAVTVNAITIFGGSAPDYRWFHNGVSVLATTSYSFVPNNNDEVFCILYSNHPCRFSTIDTSQKISFTVDTPKIPSVFIGASPGSTIELGQSDTLYVVTDAVNPTYQWYINGLPIAGATTNTYISSSFSFPKPDSVSCLVTSNGVCVVSNHTWTYITVIQVDRSGVAEIDTKNDIVILPNPNKGIFVVQGHIGLFNEDEVSIEVTNMIGQVVHKTIALTNDGKINERIQLPPQLANGMYMLSLRSGSDNRIFHIQVNQ